MTVQPAAVSLLPGDTAHLTTTILDENGSQSPVRSCGVRWHRGGHCSGTVSKRAASQVGPAGPAVVAVFGGSPGQRRLRPTRRASASRCTWTRASAIWSTSGILPDTGDAAWSLIVQLTNEQAGQYLEDRQKGSTR